MTAACSQSGELFQARGGPVDPVPPNAVHPGPRRPSPLCKASLIARSVTALQMGSSRTPRIDNI